eukprot:UN00901
MVKVGLIVMLYVVHCNKTYLTFFVSLYRFNTIHSHRKSTFEATLIHINNIMLLYIDHWLQLLSSLQKTM